jgi:hypothetical protein
MGEGRLFVAVKGRRYAYHLEWEGIENEDQCIHLSLVGEKK